MTDDRTTQTRRRLIDATIETIRRQGIAKVSARTIATTGEVNQALIFYHFGSVTNLLGEACLVTTAERLEQYGPRLDKVDSFTGLIEISRILHDEELALGNVNVLAQVLAGSQANPELAEITGRALRLWTDQVESVLRRLLVDSPFNEILEPRSLALLVSAAFIGIELVEPTELIEGEGTLAALHQLAGVAEVIDGLGPIARRAVKSTLRSR